MNREQAVTVIKNIIDRCQAVEGKSLKLLPPQANNALSYTFQIHIETSGDTMITGCVQSIAKKHNLSVKPIDRWLVVYKPYPKFNEP